MPEFLSPGHPHHAAHGARAGHRSPSWPHLTKMSLIGKTFTSTEYHRASRTESDIYSFLIPFSEADVDRSLEDPCPSSPPRVRPSVLHGTPQTVVLHASLIRSSDFHSEGLPSRLSPPEAMLQGEHSLSAPPRPFLRRAKTTSSRLDALRDVYSSVANGASQIPLDELVQATNLVHQIGAVLTEQMGKKMDKKVGDPG